MKYIVLILSVCLLPFASFAVAPITGTTIICQATTSALADATPAGTWSSSNTAVADVNSSGVVSGLTPGTADITYTEVGYSVTTVTILPQPVFSSPLLFSICDSATFNYTPASTTPGVTFDWTRAEIAGIYEHASAGSDNPNEQLLNITYAPIVVPYVYTLTSPEGCTNTQTVAVTVNPAIKLSSPLVASGICSGDMFNYAPSSFTAGATFAWSRTTLTGITPATNSGTGSIGEALTNANTTPTIVSYKFKLTANGCLAKTPEIVTVSVYSVPCKLAVEQQNTVAESKVYPNPNTGAFTIYIASATNEKAALTITNLAGTKVIEQQIATNTTTDINLDVPAGIYMLSAATATDKYFNKIVVTK